MKKTIIALALAGLAGVASAQSHVTIYGNVDAQIVKKTGSDTGMNQGIETNNMVGIKGSEDLGNGTSAIFKLEKRFHLNDGTQDTENKDGRDWSGQAYVGLSDTSLGAVRLGRINSISNEQWRAFDLNNGYGVGSALYNTNYTQRVDNTVRYDSPVFGGVQLKASYSLGENTHEDSRNARGEEIYKAGAYNDGWAVGATGSWGGFSVEGAYERLADSNKSDIWSLAVGYDTENWMYRLGYQKAEDKGYAQGEKSSWVGSTKTAYAGVNEIKTEQWVAGIGWKCTANNTLKLQGNFMKVKANGFEDADVKKYSLNWDYAMSKRTTLGAGVSYTDYDNKEVASLMGDAYRDSVTAVSIGMTHKF